MACQVREGRHPLTLELIGFLVGMERRAREQPGVVAVAVLVQRPTGLMRREQRGALEQQGEELAEMAERAESRGELGQLLVVVVVVEEMRPAHPQTEQMGRLFLLGSDKINHFQYLKVGV